MNAKFMLLNRKLARTFFVSLLKSFKFQEPCSICVDCFAIGCARAVARFHHRLEIILPRPCFAIAPDIWTYFRHPQRDILDDVSIIHQLRIIAALNRPAIAIRFLTN